MALASFEASFTIAKDKLDEAKKNIDDLFKMWRRMAEDCSWNNEVGVCEMVFTFNRQSGDFIFVTGGERDAPDWMLDETMAILRDLGRFATCPTVVRHTHEGRQADFAVGGSKREKRAAVEQHKVTKAIESLEAIKPFVPDSIDNDIDRMVMSLKTLLICEI